MRQYNVIPGMKKELTITIKVFVLWTCTILHIN